MTPVGIDLSLTSTGLSGGGMLTSIVTTKRSMERLLFMRDEIMSAVRELADPVVIIEGYSFASRNSHAHAIGELGGVVRLQLWISGIPFIDVPPTVRAKFATGRGNAAKTEVMSAVSARTGITFEGKSADDLCDAWILEEIGLVRYGIPRATWPESHLKALEKVEWV